MHVTICSINSGSNGNCYYIGSDHEAILVDTGLSCRETERRMKRAGLVMENVKAIFISHEHSDHIRGLQVLSKKYQIPVFITPNTYRNSGLSLSSELVRNFRAYENVKIGDLTVTAFPKIHDAADPHSFVISYKDVKVGVFTDIGAPCEHLIENFQQCRALFLEANYDEQLLDQGRYPYHLKNRIRGGKGHLSNAQALKLFLDYRAGNVSHVLLSHLSKDNNCPKIAYELFKQHAGNTEIAVASRYEESAKYYISSSGSTLTPGWESVNSPQLSLFNF